MGRIPRVDGFNRSLVGVALRQRCTAGAWHQRDRTWAIPERSDGRGHEKGRTPESIQPSVACSACSASAGPPRLDVEAHTVVVVPQEDDPEPRPEPEKPGTPQEPGQPQATCDSGLPFVRLVRLEPATSIAEGHILRAWVSIDQDVDQRVYGGVIISDSATGNHWHAFAFYPGEREKSVASYTVDPDADEEQRTITGGANPVFRNTYCTDGTQMTIRAAS